jgi:tetratricopeptide (TPR) repeat protein
MKRAVFLFFTLFIFVFNQLNADELDEAWVYYLKGHYTISERLVDSLIAEGKSSSSLIYLKALLCLKRGDFKSARDYFDQLCFYGGRWAQYCLSGKADAFLLEGDFEKASLLYQTFLKRYPNSDLRANVIYKYAQCLRKKGRWEEAKVFFKKLVDEYPSSLESTYARRILEEGEFYFTVQVGSFLNYDNAYNLAKKINELGYHGYIKRVEQKGKLFYRVRVGKFDQRQDAEKLLKELAKHGLSGIIYP